MRCHAQSLEHARALEGQEEKVERLTHTEIIGDNSEQNNYAELVVVESS